VTIQKSDSTILDSNLALKYSGQSLWKITWSRPG
jgi:hypothetical protein